MSLVSLHDYACPACREPYLPFAANECCPRCGEPPGPSFAAEAFADEVRGILELTWQAHARWIVPPHPKNTLGDHYVWLLVGALGRATLDAAHIDDNDDEDANAATVAAAEAEQAASQLHLGAKEYLRPHYAALFRTFFPVAQRIQQREG